MNQKLLSGFTATLLMATLGILPSHADQARALDDSSSVKVSAASDALNQEEPQAADPSAVLTANPAHPGSPAPLDAATVSSAPAQPAEAVKVGEYQSQGASPSDETVTIIHPHDLSGRRAATLYIRNIPVLTFLGSSASSASGSEASPESSSVRSVEQSIRAASPDAETKVASIQNRSAEGSAQLAIAQLAEPDRSVVGLLSDTSEAVDTNDPIWRATEISARLNQLNRDNVDATTIKVVWDEPGQRYLIKAGDDILVSMDTNTILPNTTRNRDEDALQATNLIRRQMGNAPPLQSVSGRPNSESAFSFGSVRFSVTGWASWYGPGFDGNYSASGEVFNQNALTAAHRDLPFGTQVRVTNKDNGMSVVVRINDRGPFSGDRIIDLSRGAAAAIGLIHSGVAPVNLEVLGAARAASR